MGFRFFVQDAAGDQQPAQAWQGKAAVAKEYVAAKVKANVFIDSTYAFLVDRIEVFRDTPGSGPRNNR